MSVALFLINHLAINPMIITKGRRKNNSSDKTYTATKWKTMNPYKQRYIAGSAKCTIKPLSKRLTSLLTAVKEGLTTNLLPL